jgi:hypothetical protein
MITNERTDERAELFRPVVVPEGKFGGVLISILSNDDLIHVRREAPRGGPTQGAVMAELDRRRVAMRNRKAAHVRGRRKERER